MGFFKDIHTIQKQAKEIDKTWDTGAQAREANARMAEMNQMMSQATAALAAPPEDGIEANAQLVSAGNPTGMVNTDPIVPVSSWWSRTGSRLGRSRFRSSSPHCRCIDCGQVRCFRCASAAPTPRLSPWTGCAPAEPPSCGEVPGPGSWSRARSRPGPRGRGGAVEGVAVNYLGAGLAGSTTRDAENVPDGQ